MLWVSVIPGSPPRPPSRLCLQSKLCEMKQEGASQGENMVEARIWTGTAGEWEAVNCARHILHCTGTK